MKWKLQEENNNNKPSTATTAETICDPANKGSKIKTTEDNLDTPTITTSVTSDTGTDQGHSLYGRVISAQEEHAEAMRLASGFVAAILASAMADYIAQEAEGDQDGRRLVSAAQVIT